MTRKKKGPGAPASASRARMTFEAATLNVNPIDSTDPDELHHALRIRRLHLRYGLTVSRWRRCRAAGILAIRYFH